MGTSQKEREQGQHQKAISPEELKINLMMIVQDEDAPWALSLVKHCGLTEEEKELTPDQALEICRSRLKAIKEAEKAHCKPPFG